MSTVVPEYFLEAPEQSYVEAKNFVENVEDFFQSRAESLEGDMDHSNLSGGEIQVENFKFWTNKDKAVEDLIAKSLMMYRNTNWADLKAEMRHKTRDYHSEDLENVSRDPGRKVEILKSVYDFLESEEDEIKEWLSSSRAGLYCPYTSSSFGDENGIMLEVIPESFAKKIEESHHHVLNPIIEKSVRHEKTFKEIFLHELNHAYLDNNSSITEKNRAGRGYELDEAFNEIFAYYTSYVVNGYQFKDEDSDLYSQPDLIVWGVKILIEKSREFESRGKESTGIDFERNLMEKIAQKDQPLNVFINACLLKEDKKRLREFEKIFTDLHDYLSLLRRHLDEASRETDEILEKYAMEGVESELNNIPDIENLKRTLIREIHNQMVEEGSYGDLEDMNELITEELMQITEELSDLVEKIEELESIERPETREKLKDAVEKVSNRRKSLLKVIDDGRVDI